MSENCVEIASLVRQTVLDTLKTSAPGIAEQMRQAIANSVAMKVRGQLVPEPTTRSSPDLSTVAKRNAFYNSDEYRNMTTAEKCAVQSDGFINDYD